MDFSGDDIDRDGKGGMVAEGAYCFQVTEVNPHSENTGDMVLEAEVISGTTPTEVGKKHYEYVKYPDGSLGDAANGVRRSIIRQVFYALKLTTPEELKANPKFRVDLSLAVGRLFCGKIKHEHYTSNSGEQKAKATLFQKGAWDMWAVDSPKSAGIPIPSSGNGNGSGQSSAASTPAPSSSQPAAGVNDPELDAMLG